MRTGNLIVVVIALCAMGAIASSDDSDRPTLLSPADGGMIETPLTAILQWSYPTRPVLEGYPPFMAYRGVHLTVSRHEDLSAPVVDVDLPENQTEYRFATAPQTEYFWRVTPRDEKELRPDKAVRGRFTSGAPRIDATATDAVRYANPRRLAHWLHMETVPPAAEESLSPWYEVKAYRGSAMPTFDDLRDRLPVPIYDSHQDALDAYWYCWKTLLSTWYFAPDAPDHQAVTNLCGIRAWGPWGSTMVFDTAFILHFARYGGQAYPFVTALDNCYARQHENGFICRETDKNNREVYVHFPVNPPLFAWAEWEWYTVNGDRDRLAKVFLPIVKQYEWYMTYQRRDNGLYWTNGIQEADDSPRNTLAHYAVSATSYQALAARCLGQMAEILGRDDLKAFSDEEHRQLGEMVNAHFWDERHRIYNDLAEDGRPITELTPGSLCKHVHMFWPLLAGIAPPDRVEAMVKELQNPASFNRRNGVASLSADSAGYNAETGQYWRGSVWPSGQCMVQEGLRASGRTDEARVLAEKYHAAQLEVYKSEGTIKENMAPDRPMGCGMGEFVGWGGLGPVANLIEAVLGFEIDAPRNTITWHITKTERHGIENLGLGATRVSLVCEARATPANSCAIAVKSDGPFVLRVVREGEVAEHAVGPGEHQITVE